LYKKATADKAVPSYQGYALTENRNGLVVAAEATLSAADAEVAAALTLLDRTIPAAGQRQAKQEVTLGADTGYQEKAFLNALRKREVAPHVSEYVKGNLGRNSLTEAERGDERRFRLEQAGPSVAPDQIARAGPGELVLPSDPCGA
jgi:hypothetical protein